ncbi:VWA domain-containing protein [Deinococcus taeanensis]|uniref:VWA domain-containing protein n=1 Tax=Deinococcus taeanensis TaxID=2737050 RepID=UPI001CDCC4A8|nr:VWA domain-containing protein [Deinococcus taeanensis]UBV43335.1 VWA domain-containing protein [Deinococcus taeanensis]
MSRAAPLSALLLASAANAQGASCTPPDAPLPTRTRAVFVLDTSGSMRGIGDGRADIFSRVKTQLNTYVREVKPDRVDLVTFDAGLRTRRTFERPAGSAAWNAALGALTANGSNTHLYRSLRDALRPLSASNGDVTQVFVLTDGIDNDTRAQGQAVTATDALNAFTGRGPLDRLTYIALGTDIPAEARAALQASTYASGLTLPVGAVPNLNGPGLEGGLRAVNGTTLPSPFPAGTPLTLGVTPDSAGLRLNPPAPHSPLRFSLPAGRRPGAAALLCAPPVTGERWTAPRARHVLLRLTGQPLTWLNPGADRRVQGGEDVTLRLRAAPGLNPAQATLDGVPPGVTARVDAPPGARDFTVRLRATRPQPDLAFTPALTFPGVGRVALPTLTGQPGGHTDPGAGTTRSATRPPPGSTAPPVWPWAVLLPLSALAWAFVRRRAAPVPARAAPVRPFLPGVEGLEYREDRTLHLVTATGEIAGVPTPLGGPFDLGQMARVPHLSGLRAEQHRDGLRVLRVPPDLEVSQGARLIAPGDVIRPGTLLGVAVSRRARAPQPALGGLAGLGLPLALHVRGQHLQVRGPYGEHALHLSAPVTDLGLALQAPALEGLSVSVSGRDLLLLATPATLQLRPAGSNEPLPPSAPLPGHAVIDFLPAP